jgi:ribosomal protein S20
MPNTSSAKKALRQNKTKRIVNLRVIYAYKDAVKDFLNEPSADKLKVAFSKLDIAAKKKIIHNNKASRFKARLSRRVNL